MALTKADRSGRPTGAILGRLGKGLAILVLAVTVAACSPVFRNHGYVPVEEDLAQLVVGKDTRETTGEKVGRPSASGLLNDTGWFYVQSRWQHKGALPPKEIDRQVVALTFSEAGVLQNVERFGLERGQIVPLSRRVTESNVKGMGILRQLFQNFGRINAGQVLGN